MVQKWMAEFGKKYGIYPSLNRDNKKVTAQIYHLSSINYVYVTLFFDFVWRLIINLRPDGQMLSLIYT